MKLPLWYLVVAYGAFGIQHDNGFVEDKICGELFSESKLGGNAFILKDFDQSINTGKDYRSLISGWRTTNSIRVEENCTMNICTETNFQGTCESLNGGNYDDQQFIPNLRSANCTCQRECDCKNIYLQKNTGYCGRAYLAGQCKKCNSKYLVLSNGKWFNFPPEHKNSIEAFTLRSGCYLNVYKETNSKIDVKRIKSSGLVSQFSIGSYECICDDNLYAPLTRPVSYPQILELPELKEKITELIATNGNWSQHLGLLASINSSKNRRSSKNAYILLIGFSNPKYMGLTGCSENKYNIGECHITVNIDHLGIANSQIRAIYVDILSHLYTGKRDQDHIWTASLAQYLTTHNELKDAIPNAVVVFYNINSDEDIDSENSKFQRKLAIVNALRAYIFDENYSNFILLLDGLPRLTGLEQRNPEKVIARFETAIKQKWRFPEPIFIIPRSYWTEERPMINGHWEISNKEYMYKNVQDILKLICQKRDDPLGYAIFNAAFPKERQLGVVMEKSTKLLPENHTQVALYTQLALNPWFSESVTQIQKKLQAQIQSISSQLSKEQRAREVNQKILKKQHQNLENQTLEIQKILTNQNQECGKRINEEFQSNKRKMQEIMNRIDEEKRTRSNEIHEVRRQILEKIQTDLDKIFE